MKNHKKVTTEPDFIDSSNATAEDLKRITQIILLHKAKNANKKKRAA
jgi:hypothetical protein